jgi:hypothetical protein
MVYHGETEVVGGIGVNVDPVYLYRLKPILV